MKKRYVFQTLLLICLTACGSKDEFDATGTFEATEIVVSSEATGKLFLPECGRRYTLYARNRSRTD